MKIILTLIICNYITGDCMPPHTWHETFKDGYSCSIFGYEESARKLKQIGQEEVNRLGTSITFTCTKYPESIT
tara:strand:- start:191 stop:409 length:219 start_codon:yes stop_codon:yes gene_type:complete